MEMNHPNAGANPHAGMVVESGNDFRVDTRVYLDQSVFDEEMRRIYESTWVYVGHTSEIPDAGDYKTTTVGLNPVIVSRSADGQVNVLLNECRHRANAVCRESYGNARNFQCHYHGWVYSLSGEIVGITHPQGYPADFAQKLGGLLRLRHAVYRGLIFASMTDAVPSIEDHLGDVRKYVDLWADLSPEPEFRVAKPHLYGYQGNWKFQAENGHDGWHARFVHESAFQTAADFGGPPASARSTAGCTRAFDGGFGILERHGISQGLSAAQLDAYRAALGRNRTPDELELRWHVRHIFLFPNLFLFDNLIRVIQPVDVATTNVMSHPLLLNGVSPDINRVRMHEVQARLGTTGMVSLDDLEMFAGNQTGMRGRKMRWVVLSHGMGQEEKVAGSELKGEDHSELPQRALYRQWARLMGK